MVSAAAVYVGLIVGLCILSAGLSLYAQYLAEKVRAEAEWKRDVIEELLSISRALTEEESEEV